MSRVAAAAVLTALLLAGAPARADGPPKPPDAAKVRTAAEQFDAGMTANKAKDYASAASHFEAADAAVPSPNALRQAIRARDKAAQGSRAATLAALALERYPSDDATTKLAREIIDKYLPQLHKLNVSCPSPCVLAIGTRSVPGDANTRWTVYLDPSKDKDPISASFFGGVASAPREIAAKAGGFEEIRLEPVEPKASPPPPPPPPPPVVKPDPPKSDPEQPPAEAKPPEPKGISPIFFGVGAAATAGLGATLIWSAVDTQTNPGPDKVREACKGKGESCPEFQDALSKQRRTNILIGVTAGTAAVTVALAIFTRWRSPKKTPEPAAFTWAPTAVVVDRGAVLGAAVAF